MRKGADHYPPGASCEVCSVVASCERAHDKEEADPRETPGENATVPSPGWAHIVLVNVVPHFVIAREPEQKRGQKDPAPAEQ